MNGLFEKVQKSCPQCGKAVDVDARFCKYCAFNLTNSDVKQISSTEINQIQTKNNTPIIFGGIGLLVAVIVGLVIFFNTNGDNQSVVENANSAAQTSLTLNEKGQQIEEKILRGGSLSATDLEGFSPQELRVLRNVHFARYGRKFDRPGLGDYFYNRSWYKPNDSFNDTMLNSIDKENVKLILSIEKPELAQSTPLNPSTEEEAENSEETHSSKLYSEAQKLAKTFWKKNLSKCGDSYYFEVTKVELGLGTIYELYECRGEPSTFAEGEEFEARLLTEAEKLNGVDPHPAEWNGNATVSFAACRYISKRRVSAPGKITFREWKDNVSYRMPLWKSKGQWYLPNILPLEDRTTEKKGAFIEPIQCSNLQQKIQELSVSP